MSMGLEAASGVWGTRRVVSPPTEYSNSSFPNGLQRWETPCRNLRNITIV